MRVLNTVEKREGGEEGTHIHVHLTFESANNYQRLSFVESVGFSEFHTCGLRANVLQP